MTDYTNIQGALLTQADYEGRVPCTSNQYRARIMRDAAEYIERLERDKLALETSNKAIAAQRDLEIRCRLDNAHLLTEAAEKLAAVTAERDKLYEAPIYRHNVRESQVRVNQLERLVSHLEIERDQLRAQVAGINQPGSYPRPRYVVQQIDGYGPNRKPNTWYKIVDRATPLPFPHGGFKRVGVAYDATDARHIAEMFETRYGDKS